MITGGYGSGRDTAEVWQPGLGAPCSLPDMPEDRRYHTQEGGDICGRRRRKHLHHLHPLEQQHLDGHQQHPDRQEGRSLLLEDGGRLSHTDGGRLRQPLLRGCQH